MESNTPRGAHGVGYSAMDTRSLLEHEPLDWSLPSTTIATTQPEGLPPRPALPRGELIDDQQSESSLTVTTLSRDPYSVEFSVEFEMIEFADSAGRMTDYGSISEGGMKKHRHSKPLRKSISEMSVRLQDSCTDKMVGYACLVLAVTLTAAQPVVYKYIPVKNPYLRMTWWYCILLLTSVPQYVKHIWNITEKEKAAYRKWQNILAIALTSTCCTTWTVTWVAALKFTTLTHVTLFSQMHPLLFVFVKFLKYRRLAWTEVAGVLAGYSGVMMCLLGHSAQQTGPGVHLGGDMLAMMSTLGATGYILGGQYIRRDLPAISFTFPYSVQVLSTAVAMTFLTSSPTFDRNQQTGLFGLFNNAHLFGLVCLLGMLSFVGIITYTTSFKYLPNVVLSCAMLMEPVIATMGGLLMGVAAMPSVYTQLGGFLVLTGVAAVIVVSQQEDKKRAKALEEHIRSEKMAEGSQTQLQGAV